MLIIRANINIIKVIVNLSFKLINILRFNKKESIYIIIILNILTFFLLVLLITYIKLIINIIIKVIRYNNKFLVLYN